MGILMSVDDDRIVRKLISDVFDAEGIEIVTARNPIEALEIASENEVDVAILDIDMPFMSGFELQLKLHEIDPFTKVIFLSSQMNRATLLRAMRGGACDFHKKPFIPDDLVESVLKQREQVIKFRKMGFKRRTTV